MTIEQMNELYKAEEEHYAGNTIWRIDLRDAEHSMVIAKLEEDSDWITMLYDLVTYTDEKHWPTLTDAYEYFLSRSWENEKIN